MTNDVNKTIKEFEAVLDDANPWKESPPVSCSVPYELLRNILNIVKVQQSEIEKTKIDYTTIDISSLTTNQIVAKIKELEAKKEFIVNEAYEEIHRISHLMAKLYNSMKNTMDGD